MEQKDTIETKAKIRLLFDSDCEDFDTHNSDKEEIESDDDTDSEEERLWIAQQVIALKKEYRLMKQQEKIQMRYALYESYQDTKQKDLKCNPQGVPYADIEDL